MAKIDKLIDMMLQRNVDRVVIIADQPLQIFAQGRQAAGNTLNQNQVQGLLEEVVPQEILPSLAEKGSSKFVYQSSQGEFQIGFSYQDDVLQMILKAQLAAPVDMAFKPQPKPVVLPNQPAEPKLLTTLNERDRPAYCVAFSPDGACLASGLGDARVNLWNLNTGQVVQTINHGGVVGGALATLQSKQDSKGKMSARPQSSISALAFAPDGKTLVTQSRNKVRSWDMPEGKSARNLKYFNILSNRYSLAFSPDGETLASGSMDGVVVQWDFSTGKEKRGLAHQWMIAGFPISLLTLLEGSIMQTIRLHLGQTAVAFSPDGKSIATGYYREVKVWNAQTRELKRSMEEGETSVAMSMLTPLIPYLRLRASISKVGDMARIISLAFSSDGKTIATGHWSSGPSNLMLWDSETGKKTYLKGHGETTNAVLFSPDARTLISAGQGGDIKFWDVASGELLRTHKAHAAAINDLALTPDGRTLASASDDKIIKLWLLR